MPHQGVGDQIVVGSVSNGGRSGQTAADEQLLRRLHPDGLGRRRFASADGSMTTPSGFWFRPHTVDPTTATAYLPRIGSLDDNPASAPMSTDHDHDREQAAAAQALRQRTPPDGTLLERILNGLRRL